MTNEYLCEVGDCDMAVQCKVNGKRLCWNHWEKFQVLVKRINGDV